MNHYLSEHTKKLKDNLGDISSEEAKKFMYKYGYVSSSFVLPEYIQPKGFNQMELDEVNWSGNNFNLQRTKPISILAPKNNFEWRRFNLIHPYSYWHIVNIITGKESDYKTAIDFLTQQCKISSYTVPKLKKGTTSLQGRNIKSWLNFAESDIVKDSTEYEYIAVTDIKNYYPGVYTHSIPWALHGKAEMKKPTNMYDFAYLGNKLDKAFQNSREGQTNGIPTGTLVSNIIAEIILTRVDIELEKKTQDFNYIGGRFRDDYRFLCKNEHHAKEILRALNMILHEYFDLSLNNNKTDIEDDIIIKSKRQWKQKIEESTVLAPVIKGDLRGGIESSQLYDILFETYSIQHEYKSWRVAITVIAKLLHMIDKGKIDVSIPKHEMARLIALLRKLMLIREDTTPHIMVLLDRFLNDQNKSVVKESLEHLHSLVQKQADKDFQELWIHRLALHHYPEFSSEISQKSDSSLMSIISDRHNQHDYEYFDVVDEDFSSSDRDNLEKFQLVNRKMLHELEEQPIDKDTINPFKY